MIAQWRERQLTTFLKCVACLQRTASGRKRLLDTSAILQDDSGIPLPQFEAKKRRFRAFGHYAGPISTFATAQYPTGSRLVPTAKQEPCPSFYRLEWVTVVANSGLSVLNPCLGR
jgi:hypothetical protein